MFDDVELVSRAQKGEPAAVAELVQLHQGFVASFARKMRRYGAPHEDLVQEGVGGLLESVPLYQPSKGRFLTFAGYRVRWRIYQAVFAHVAAGMASPSSSWGRMFFRLSRAMKEAEGRCADGGDAACEAAAAQRAFGLRVRPEHVQAMQQWQRGPVPLDMELEAERPGPEDQAAAREEAGLAARRVQQLAACLDTRELAAVVLQDCLDAPLPVSSELLRLEAAEGRRLHATARRKLRAAARREQAVELAQLEVLAVLRTTAASHWMLRRRIRMRAEAVTAAVRALANAGKIARVRRIPLTGHATCTSPYDLWERVR